MKMQPASCSEPGLPRTWSLLQDHPTPVILIQCRVLFESTFAPPPLPLLSVSLSFPHPSLQTVLSEATFAWINACSCSNSLVLCSTIPRYCSTVLSVTPAWPPSMSVMAEASQPVLENTESMPAETHTKPKL